MVIPALKAVRASLVAPAQEDAKVNLVVLDLEVLKAVKVTLVALDLKDQRVILELPVTLVV